MEYYLVVSCLCTIINLTSAAHALRKVKKQDYEIKDMKNFIYMVVGDVIFKSFIPGYRLYFLYKRIDDLEKYVDEIIEKGLENDFIEKLDDESIEESLENEDEQLVEENTLEEDKEHFSVIVYDTLYELTREQKIQFLKEEYMRLTGKSIENTKNEPKQKRR